jgi:hypothetical protein
LLKVEAKVEVESGSEGRGDMFFRKLKNEIRKYVFSVAQNEKGDQV